MNQSIAMKASHGKLAPQSPNDEPESKFLTGTRIHTTRKTVAAMNGMRARSKHEL